MYYNIFAVKNQAKMRFLRNFLLVLNYNFQKNEKRFPRKTRKKAVKIKKEGKRKEKEGRKRG